MGENGAGKSTLMQIIAGVHQPDAGTIEYFGQPVRLTNPSEAQAKGIAIVYQELNLATNLCLSFDEPTRGVDIGTKAEIYALFDELVLEGIAILVISSDFPEVLALADRILIMRHGQLTGELSRSNATEEKVMNLAALGPLESEAA